VSAFFILGVWLSARTLRTKPVSGAVGYVGQEGDARTPIDRRDGKVFVAGTYWNAVADTAIPAGAKIRVVGVTGMTFKVEALKQDA
jgi:membrane protein implicated in regulation of membrane protease activity